jgi:formylglycine-generating enzyme required for sulfatase activity
VNTARQAERWEEAITTAEQLVEQAPEDKSFQTLVDDLKTSQRQAILDDLQGQVKSAQQAERWDEALQAAEKLVELAPEDDSFQALVADLKASQRRAKLDQLLREACTALGGEQWRAAESAFEAYLKEAPEDPEKVEADLAKARKYAQISEDYVAAQEMINKRQFNKAVPLLQGIVAQDPTYKSTSRLLVEAVEARSQRKPIRINPKLWIPVGAVVVIVILGVIFSDQIRGWLTARSQTTPISEVETPEVGSIPTSVDEETEESQVNSTAEPVLSAEISAGSIQINAIDGAELVYVPAGEFLMGNESGDPDESPEHEVYLSAYWIYKYEVTNAQYRLCIQAGECTGDIENYPANNYPVSNAIWLHAENYCEWAGGRVPTEAEWEKAARGDEGRYPYPWGDGINCNLANFEKCEEGVAQVGSYLEGASPYGVLDMAGNVWEWVADYYNDRYYSKSPITNPMGPESGNERIIRGGSWVSDIQFLRVSNRVSQFPLSFVSSSHDKRPNIGFRCVMDEADPLWGSATEETQTEPSTPDTSGVSKGVNMSFIEPILSYIAGRPPDVEDDFRGSYAWEPVDMTSTKEIVDNELRIEDGVYKNRFVNFFDDFVLEVDVRPNDIYFSGFNLSWLGRFGIQSNGQWEVAYLASDIYGKIYDYDRSGFVQSSSIYHLQLIIKGTEIVYIVNNEPVAYFDNEVWKILGKNDTMQYLWSSGVGFFDNFKAWDISQFDLPNN